MAESKIKKLWVSIAALIAMIVGIVAGLLEWHMNHSVPGAILYAGGAFIVTLPLLILIMRELGVLDSTTK